MNFKDRIILFFATGCYIGRVPLAPGTFGSIPGLVIYFAISGIALWYQIIFLILFVLLSIWISREAERILRSKDPGCIVIDETAGMMVTLMGLPFNLFTGLAGFIVFRFFDILKPYPIRYFEKNVPGGLGIVMDDVVAGIMGNLILRIMFFLIQTRYIL